MNYINGLKYLVAQAVADGGAYAQPARNLRRLLWVFLQKVVGWTDEDKSGANWDNPLLTGADGYTDSLNPFMFYSPGAGFTSAHIGRHLIIHPTDATSSTAGGFTNPEFNGMYIIKNVVGSDRLVVDKSMGVHLSGFPLNESSLAFRIDDFYTNAYAPADNNFFVLGGSVDGYSSFHFRNRERYDATYGKSYFQISPYGDWDSVAHDWDVNNRVSTEVGMVWGSQNTGTLNEMTLYAGADEYGFWMHGFWGYNGVSMGDGFFWSVGKFTNFHAVDTKPIIMAIGVKTGAFYDPFQLIGTTTVAATAYCSLFGTNSDGTVPITYVLRRMCKGRDSAIPIVSSDAITASRYSGRQMSLPLIITSEVAGYEGIRGQFSMFKMGLDQTYIGGQPKTLGNSKEFLYIYNLVYPWNGSDVRQTYYGIV